MELAPSTYRRRPLLLLIKAGEFKHSGGFALYGNPPRWHKVHAHKPAPKGAPVAHDPSGIDASAYQMPAEQVGQLKIPDANTNAPSFNKQVDKLVGYAAAGDAAAILGMSIGTNTYGVKLAKIASWLLQSMGVQHQVAPGQKPGSHAAVQAPPDAAAPDAKGPAPTPAEPPAPVPPAPAAPPPLAEHVKETLARQAAKQKPPEPAAAQEPALVGGKLAMPEFAEGKTKVGPKAYYEKIAAKVIAQAEAGNVAVLEDMVNPEAKSWQGKTANSKKLLALHAAALEHAKGAPPDQQEPSIEPGVKSHLDKLAAGPDAAEQLAQAASAKYGPAADPEVTAYAKKLLAAHTAASKRSNGGEAILLPGVKAAIDRMGEKAQTDSLKTVLSANADNPAVVKYAQQILDKTQAKMAASADHKEGDTKPAADGGTLVLKNGRWVKQGGDTSPHDTPVTKVLHVIPSDDAAANYNVLIGTPKSAPGSKFSVIVKDGDSGEAMPVVKVFDKKSAALDYAHKLASAKNPYADVSAPAPTPADTPNPLTGSNAFKHLGQAEDNGGVFAVKLAAADWAAANPGSHAALFSALTDLGYPSLASAYQPKPAPATAPMTGTLTADQLGKLQSIPWFKLKLPAENTNAKSHNAALSKIQAMAFAGDAAGLQAFIDGKAGAKQTYAKKQHLLAQTALAALKDGGAQTAAPSAPAPASPLSEQPAYDYLAGIQKQTAGKPGALEAAKDAADAWLAANPGAWGELNEGLASLGYYDLADYGPAGAAAAAGAEAGPKDGDTKPAADGGTLVFKDGRWHKQAEPKAAAAPASEPAPSGVDAVQIPVFTGGGSWDQHYTNVAEALKTLVKAGGTDALKGVVVNHSDGRFSVSVANVKLKKIGPEGSNNGSAEANARRALMHKFITDLKAAAGPAKKGAKKAAPKAAAPAATALGGIPSIDTWQQTGGQGGSNPGGKFKDPEGKEWYCKFPPNSDHAKSEVLAAKLYEAAGLHAQKAMLVTKDGKLGIASEWKDLTFAPDKLASAEGAQAGFAVDAWLANYDVVGPDFKNMQLDGGKAFRLDNGGALEYRAQGAKKADFGVEVGELASMRDPKINAATAKVFGSMTTADITASVAKVAAVHDLAIRALVNQYGPGGEADKKKLADLLIARKANLIAKYPKAVKAKKAPVFDPSKITAPPNFMSWGNSGKPGPSSKEFVNTSNDAAVQKIYAAAKTGKAENIQNLQVDVYNKDTGQVTGQSPVLSHPSQHVKGYAAQALSEIQYQMNPPKQFRFEGGHPIKALHDAFPSYKGSAHDGVVAHCAKFLLLGDVGAIKIEDLGLPEKITYQSGALTRQTYSPAARAAIKAMPTSQRQAIAKYTGSGYSSMNASMWTGNEAGAAAAAASALKTHSHEIAPGTILSRKLKHIAGKDLEDLLNSTGQIIQENRIISTSIRPSSWQGNVQLKLHAGPGVKGLWVGIGSDGEHSALSVNASEDEMILPPKTRLLVLSVRKGGTSDADGFGGDVQHVIEAVILPTEE